MRYLSPATMLNNRLNFAAPRDAPRWKRWFIYSPYARLVILVAIVAAADTLLLLGSAAAGIKVDLKKPFEHPLITLGTQLMPVIAYILLVSVIERRRVRELSLRNAPTLGVAGFGVGVALMSAVVGVLWLAGSYHVTGEHRHVAWLSQVLILGIGSGVGEEVLFRGGLFRLLEEGTGTWWALAASSLFFGFAHLFNPGASLSDSAAIAIEAGLLLALVYHVTRSLWPCIGLHAAWNMMQGTVYGIPVSGQAGSGWLVSHRTGPTWLSGGAFGAEASVVALVLCAACSLVLLWVAIRRRSIVPPSWRRGAAGIAVPE